MCEQKTVTQVELNTRIMSGAKEWLWEFKKKLDSTIAPTELVTVTPLGYGDTIRLR